MSGEDITYKERLVTLSKLIDTIIDQPDFFSSPTQLAYVDGLRFALGLIGEGKLHEIEREKQNENRN